MKRIEGSGRSDAKTPRQGSGPLHVTKSKSQKVRVESKPSLNVNSINNNPTSEVKFAKRKVEKQNLYQHSSASTSTRPSSSKILHEQHDFKVSNSTGSIGFGLHKRKGYLALGPVLKQSQNDSNSIAPLGTNTPKDSHSLYKSHYWSKIDPVKYPFPKEQLAAPQIFSEKEKPDSGQLQQFIIKQKELRRKQAKLEQEAQELEITKKRQKLVDLEQKRRELVRKFKTNPLLPQQEVELERSRKRNHEKLFAYRPPPLHVPAPQPVIKKRRKPPPTAASSKSKDKNFTTILPSRSSSRECSRSRSDPGAGIRTAMILQEYRNIVAAEEANAEIELAVEFSALSGNLASCDESTETALNLLDSIKPRYSIGLRDLAASKIQGAFRQYKIRKLWREIREQKCQQLSKTSPKPQPKETTKKMESEKTEYKSPLSSSISEPFQVRLGSPLHRLPQYHHGISSSNVNCSFVSKLSRFEDVFPSESTIKQLNYERANSPNGCASLSSLYQVKSFELGVLSKYFENEDFPISPRAVTVPKVVQELLIPVSPGSNVLKDKIRILKEKAEKKQKQPCSKQYPTATESDYIGPDNEAMHEAYKLRLSLQQSSEALLENTQAQKNKLAKLKLQSEQVLQTNLESSSVDSLLQVKTVKEQEDLLKVQCLEPIVLERSISLNSNLQQFVKNANKQELIVETVQVELDDKEIPESSNHTTTNESSKIFPLHKSDDLLKFDEQVTTPIVPNSSEFDAFQYLESKKAAVESLDATSNDISYYSELISEVNISSGTEQQEDALSLPSKESENEVHKDESQTINTPKVLKDLTDEEEKGSGESLIVQQNEASLEEYGSRLSSPIEVVCEVDRILDEALAYSSDEENQSASAEDENSSSGEEDSIMKRMGMDYNFQDYINGLESEEDLLEIYENDSIFQQEASVLLQAQERIEAEIRELQELEKLSIVNEIPICPPSPRSYALDNSSPGTEMYLSPPASAFEEIKIPSVTIPIGKLKKFVGIKSELAWKAWKSGEEYTEQIPDLKDLEINFPFAESSPDDSQLIQPAKESYKELLNYVTDEVIREVLQLEPKVPSQQPSFMDQVRPGLIAYKFRDQLLPKSQDELNKMIFNRVTKLIPNKNLIYDDDGEPVKLDKPSFKWSGKQKDRIDEVVLEELFQMETEWKSVWPEGIIVKDQLCDRLIKRTIVELLEDLARTGSTINIEQ